MDHRDMWIVSQTAQPLPLPPAAAFVPPPDFHPSIFSGTSGLLIPYGIAFAAVVVGLRAQRAPWDWYYKAPLSALVIFVLGAIVAALLRLFIPPVVAAILAILLVIYTGYWKGRRFKPIKSDPRHHRGTIVGYAADAAGRTQPGPAATHPITLAGLPVALLDETKHFKFIGTTGTGKSTAIREILSGALARGDRAVIADPGGGYLARYYDPGRGDVILNPFDPRSAKWDVMGEIRQPYDFNEMARSFVPETSGGGEQLVWQRYGQTFLSAVMRQASGSGVRDSTELYRLLTTAPLEELRLLLEGTPAQPFLQSANDRMFGSIRSVTTTAVSALEFINLQEGEPFSIRNWIREGRGVLFLPYQADQIAALRAVISTWMRTANVETLTLPEGDARLWFVVDELDALGPIDGLKDALPRLRKCGGRYVLGFQSIAQVSGTYGRAAAETIVENCGNTLILRCSSGEGGGTAQFASRLIGDREIVREVISKSRRPREWLSTTSQTHQHVTEAAVLPSEIEQLPDLEGYLKFASMGAWTHAELQPPRN